MLIEHKTEKVIEEDENKKDQKNLLNITYKVKSNKSNL